MPKPQRKQTLMIETETDTVDPGVIAEILTRSGYNVTSVEAERGGDWRRDARKPTPKAPSFPQTYPK